MTLRRLFLRRALLPLSVASAWVMPALLLAQAPARPPAREPRAETAPAQATRPGYQIGPGDVLQVFVWREPDLTRDVTVRSDGRISVPLLGDVEAAGKTPDQLSVALATALGKFLASPQVTVGVTQPNSNKFYVLGKVNKPGEYPLHANLTVLQALALAGGFGEYAKADSITVVRSGGAAGGQTVLPFNYKRVEDGRELGQNILLRPGDTIIVP